MKVGIITLHNNRNKGALLQNYCLVKTVESILPDATIETVDVRCLSNEIKRYKNSLITKQISAIPARIRDFRQSKQFLREYCNLSKNSCISDSYEKTTHFVNRQEYNLLLFGSDTVWKITEGYDKRFSDQRPFPNIYFGGTELLASKIAYAASANKTDVERFTKSERQFLIESLKDFSAIGVRDVHTEDLLQKIGIETFNRVPDPTFLHEIPSSKTDIIKKTNDPTVGVNTPKSPLISELIDQLREDGYQIISPNTSLYSDLDFVGDLSPFEYYKIHDEFDFMITSSLHSTIFCLQHETPFLTIDLNSSYKKLYSKTKSLLSEFDLLDRHIDGFQKHSSDIRLEDYTDFHSSERTQIKIVLQQHRQNGREFLQQTLSNHIDQPND